MFSNHCSLRWKFFAQKRKQMTNVRFLFVLGFCRRLAPRERRKRSIQKFQLLKHTVSRGRREKKKNPRRNEPCQIGSQLYFIDVEPIYVSPRPVSKQPKSMNKTKN